MSVANTLLSYGIAINFFGNYRQEASAIESINGRIRTSLNSIVQMFVGGLVGYSFKSFMDNLINTGKQMEMQFAQIKGVLGDVGKTIEMLNWAKIKGLQTSLSDTEVVDAVVSMTRMGLSRDRQSRDKNFQALADFTAMYLKPKGFTFSDAVDMVSKAGFGNWERLGDNFGMRKQTIGTQWKSAVQSKGITEDKTSWDKFTKEDVARGDKLVAYLQKAKQGTDQYRDSLVELLGLMSKGGMMATMDTFTGVMSNLMEIPEGFMKSLVGYAQVHGTVFNALVNNMKDFFGVVTQEAANGETAVGNFFRFASDIGYMFVGDINRMGKSMKTWAERVRNFFLDYQNKLAPVILFLALVKIQVEEIALSFYEGFEPVFGWFIKIIPGIYMGFAKLLGWIGLTDGSAKSTARTLGQIFGIIVGIQAVKMAISPILFLWRQTLILRQALISTAVLMDGLLFKGRILAGLTRMSQGNVQSGMTLISGGIARFGTALSSAGSAIMAFLATPLGLVVVLVLAIVAWVVYLVTHWEEVGQKMQGVSDIALVMLSVFMPIIGIPLILAKYWKDFKKIFMNIWKGIKGYLTGFWIWMRENIIKPIGEFFGAVWDFVKEKSISLFNWVMDKFPLMKILFMAIRDIWKEVSEFISKIWDKFTNNNFIKSISGLFKYSNGAFSSGGEEYANRMTQKYGTEEEKKDLYQKIGVGAIPNQGGGVTNQFTVGSLNVHTNQEGRKFGGDLHDILKKGMNKKSAMGK